MCNADKRKVELACYHIDCQCGHCKVELGVRFAHNLL